MVWLYGGGFLRPFGFPQGAEAEAQGALNLGIKDQVVALQWIKSNIAAFGGDPEKIMESGFQSTVPMFNASMREPAWASFVNATPECSGTGESDTFSCLRRANLSTLVDSFNSVLTSGLQSFPFAPVLDGPGGLIPALPSDLLA
ncbi:hypothetical protein PHLCEN_2v3063 [Hermanssonia centrifuga]|uniref:Carboxylesterase type B domain-containing protein n=1 Tax=Hermanssonia centrifuga TaxID=98765 RepID=A0A2R6R7A2_9APHY|nr:hypothetical protein PHLCEN_2v3063 [Hermanssonia centrifuga]